MTRLSNQRGGKIVRVTTLGDFAASSIDGGDVDLSTYDGQVVLVVNTASRCGLTPQYEGLEQLYRAHKDEGLVVLGFPCDQFAHQEPGSAEEISDFCTMNYGVSFPMFAKVDVNGEDAHPLFQQLTAVPDADGKGGDVSWNFEKWVVNGQGDVVARFRPMTTPDAPEVRAAIESVLPG